MSNVNLKPFLIEHFDFKLWLAMLCWHKLTLSLTVEATELFEVRWKQLIFSFPFRMWRNEVNMRKRERTRQQAEELRKMQKLFLLKAMSSPGRVLSEDIRLFSLWFVAREGCCWAARPVWWRWSPDQTPGHQTTHHHQQTLQDSIIFLTSPSLSFTILI